MIDNRQTDASDFIYLFIILFYATAVGQKGVK